MFIFFLKKLRKLLKSIGKLENNIIEKIVLLEKENKSKFNYSIIKNNNPSNSEYQINQKKNYPKKLAVVICFYFNEKKLNILKKTINEINSYRFNVDLTLITNQLLNKQKKTLNNFIHPKIRIYEAKEMPDADLLPWYSINVMKKKYENKTFSHFLFIEDDILITSQNICYWIYFRKILKKINLIPGFLRYENFKKDLYAVDYEKKISFNKCPKLRIKNTNITLINPRYPYSAMYMMDRDLMKNYLKSKATKIDFSFTNNFLKSKAPIKELLNVSHTFLNIPKGFFNTILIPLDKNKEISNYCLIEHLDLKYANSRKLKNMGFGKIRIKDLIK